MPRFSSSQSPNVNNIDSDDNDLIANNKNQNEMENSERILKPYIPPADEKEYFGPLATHPSKAKPEWALRNTERSLISPRSRPLKPSERPIEEWEHSIFYALEPKKTIKEELSEFFDEPKQLTPEWKALNIKMSGMDFSTIELSRTGKKLLYLFCVLFPVVSIFYVSRDEWMPHMEVRLDNFVGYVKAYFWERKESNVAPIALVDVQADLAKHAPQGGILTAKALAEKFNILLPQISQPVHPGYVMYLFEEARFKSTTIVRYNMMYPLVRTLFIADDYFMNIDTKSGRRHCPLLEVLRLTQSIGRLSDEEMVYLVLSLSF